MVRQFSKSKMSPHLWTSLQRVLTAYLQVRKRVEFVKCVLECVPVLFLFLFCLLRVSPIRPMFHLQYFGHHFPPKLKVEFLVGGQWEEHRFLHPFSRFRATHLIRRCNGVTSWG